MLRKMNRREAYFAALKFRFQDQFFGSDAVVNRYDAKLAYAHAKRLAAEYAFRVRSEDLTSIPVWS